MITDRERYLMFEAVHFYRQKRLPFIEALDGWVHEDGDDLSRIADDYAEE